MKTNIDEDFLNKMSFGTAINVLNAERMSSINISESNVTGIQTNSSNPDGIDTDVSMTDIFKVAKFLTVYIQPILCIVGLIGNFISVLVFLSDSLRKASSNIYLTALSGSSCIFCLSLFVVWLEVIKVDVVNLPVICQIIVYTTYVCSFLNVWFVVCITFENYVVTVHLKHAVYICTVHKARIIVCILSASGIILYSFALWTTKVELVHGAAVCTVAYEFQFMVDTVTYIDMALTLLVPSVAMVIFIGAIMTKHAWRRSYETMVCAKGIQMHGRSSVISKNDESVLKITRVLLAISLSYMVFSAPMYINKIRFLIIDTTHVSKLPTIKDMALNQIYQVIYYITFCLNIIYYLKWSINYRKALGSLLCGRIHLGSNIESKVLNLPLVNLSRRRGTPIIL